MTELSITRGRDIVLFLNGEPLCGVTHMKAQSRYPRRELYEYLSSEPYAAAPQGESHEIGLTVLALFSGAIPMEGSFTLLAVDGEEEILYEGCAVIGCSRELMGDKTVADTYTLRADRMTKRRNNHA